MAKRESFSEAFSPYLQNTATMISRMLIADKEREKDKLDWQAKEDYKKKTDAENLQIQSEALAKYRAGGETALTGVPDIFGIKPNKSNLGLDVNIPNQNNDIVIPETKTRFRNYSPQERMKIGLTGGLTPFQVNQDQEPPKPQDIYEGYLEKLHKRYGRNKYTNQLEVVQDYGEGYNPAFNDWKVNEIPKSAYRDTKTGKWFKKIGYQDIDTGEWKQNEKGEIVLKEEKPFPITKTGTNGEKIFSKDVESLSNNYEKDIDKLLVLVSSGIDPETGGKATPEQIKGWKGQLGQESLDYSNFVDNTASSRFKKFNVDIYNGTTGGKKPKTNPVPLVFWKEGMERGREYGFTPKDYQTLRKKFIATYKADPLKLYGISGFEHYFDEEENDNTNEEEY